jgi:hypothetical protein
VAPSKRPTRIEAVGNPGIAPAEVVSKVVVVAVSVLVDVKVALTVSMYDVEVTDKVVVAVFVTVAT